MLKYHASKQHREYYFDPKLQAIMAEVEALYPDTNAANIHVYPDAMFKPNGTPNGIAIETNPNNTLLMPSVLRDPGCGFCCFKLNFKQSPPRNWQQHGGGLLNKYLNSNAAANCAMVTRKIRSTAMQDILHYGLEAIDISKENLALFSNTQFNVDPSIVKLTKNELSILESDLCDLTNNLEIRSIKQIFQSKDLQQAGITPNDLIGFIHSGSHEFPGILMRRFLQPTGDLAHFQKAIPVAKIQQGLFGIPLLTDLGQEYHAWLNAAMNYALVSRYGIFLAVQEFYQKHFSATVELINDRIHAGIFTLNSNKNKIIRCLRGVQEIIPQTNNHKLNLGLLAGHRETPAYLVTSGNNQDRNYVFSHGSNAKIEPNHYYSDRYLPDIPHLQTVVKQAYYNTTPDLSACLPLTYNSTMALKYFSHESIIKPVAMLYPEINVFGHFMRAHYQSKSQQKGISQAA